MDWRTSLTAFAMIFLAELGDKTQLTTMVMAAQTRSPVAVFLGAAAALVLTSLLGVAFGEAITRVVPVRLIRSVAGAFFVVVGILLLVSRGK